MILRALLLTFFALRAFAESQSPSRIAFGSCANQGRPQPIWQAIRDAQPDLFIFLGDNVYADSPDPAKIRAAYDALALQPSFEQFRQRVPILAIWDDHDYGSDDAGVEFTAKEPSKAEFARFFGMTSARASRPGNYDAIMYDDGRHRLQVVLLDTRWFRSPLQRSTGSVPSGHGPYAPSTNVSASMLGADQWQWLEQELAKPADVRLIASSIQVIATDHGWEKWGNFPKERERLLKLARESSGKTIFLTGDRHFGEISCLKNQLCDITASPLAATIGSQPEEKNGYRIGEPYRQTNFGLLTIDWTTHPPTTSAELLDRNGKTRRRISIQGGSK